MKQSALVACLVAPLVLCASTAAAQPSRRPFDVAPETPPPSTPPRLAARLDYTRGPGAESCPDESTLRDAVAAHVGRDPFEPSARVRLATSITRQGSSFIAVLERYDASGARTWTHPPISERDCDKLVRVVGLSIAVAIDPLAEAARAAQAAPPSLPPPAPAPPSPPTIDAAPAANVAPERPKIRVGLGAAVEMGIAPAAAAGLTAQAGVRFPRWSLGVEGKATLPASSGAIAGAGSVRAMLLAGSLVPCGHIPLPLPKSNVAACGLLTLGALRAEGSGVDAPSSGAAFHASAGLRLGLEIAVGGPIALRVGGDLLGTLQPTTVQLDGKGVWTVGRVTGSLGGGAVAEF